jgi:hypothetical protein
MHKAVKDRKIMATNIGLAGNSQMAGQQKMQNNTPVDSLWDTRTKMLKTVWLSIGLFLVPFLVLVSWYLIKHPRIVTVNATDNYSVPQKTYSVPRNASGDKIGRMVVDHGVSKVVFDHMPTMREMPENQKLKGVIFFLKDGTAALITVDAEYEGDGSDTVWRSGGQWFGILNNPVVTEHDSRFLGYDNLKSCGHDCVPVIIKK